jgi:hypothetical protein
MLHRPRGLSLSEHSEPEGLEDERRFVDGIQTCGLAFHGKPTGHTTPNILVV